MSNENSLTRWKEDTIKNCGSYYNSGLIDYLRRYPIESGVIKSNIIKPDVIEEPDSTKSDSTDEIIGYCLSFGIKLDFDKIYLSEDRFNKKFRSALEKKYIKDIESELERIKKIPYSKLVDMIGQSTVDHEMYHAIGDYEGKNFSEKKAIDFQRKIAMNRRFVDRDWHTFLHVVINEYFDPYYKEK